MTFDVAIIGGGISGLATAYALMRGGNKVVVLERQQRVGGNAVSERFDGFLMEHGPTTLNAMVPQALALSHELGLDDARIDMGKDVRKRYLLDDGELHGISTHPAGFLFSPYLSLSGRINVMLEMFRRRRPADKDETIHAFATRRFGREFADKVMEPLAAGIFSGDSTKLSLKSAFPKLAALEQKYGSISLGVIRAKTKTEPGKRLFCFQDGVGTLPIALAEKIAASVHCGTAVKRIAKTLTGFKIETSVGSIQSKTIVVATQPHVTAQLLAPLDDVGSMIAAQIEAPAVSVVYLGYKRWQISHPLDSLGFLTTKNNEGILSGAQFCSTLFEGRAPEGHVSIAGYVGGVRNPQAALLPASELITQVHDELTTILAIKGNPVVARCRQWPRGMPQYNIGHQLLVDQLLQTGERVPGLFVTGNYLAGVSVANCIAQAGQTAGAVSSHLHGETLSRSGDQTIAIGEQ